MMMMSRLRITIEKPTMAGRAIIDPSAMRDPITDLRNQVAVSRMPRRQYPHRARPDWWK
jgi:hypothetical protein